MRKGLSILLVFLFLLAAVVPGIAEGGFEEEEIDIEKSEGINIGISFSSKFMLEALRTFDDNELIFLLNSETKPIVIKSAKDETLIQLILPIKTY